VAEARNALIAAGEIAGVGADARLDDAPLMAAIAFGTLW
jgi:hypothetical protein